MDVNFSVDGDLELQPCSPGLEWVQSEYGDLQLTDDGAGEDTPILLPDRPTGHQPHHEHHLRVHPKPAEVGQYRHTSLESENVDGRCTCKFMKLIWA